MYFVINNFDHNCEVLGMNPWVSSQQINYTYGSKGRDHVMVVQGSRKVPHYQEIMLGLCSNISIREYSRPFSALNKSRNLRLISPWILAYITWDSCTLPISASVEVIKREIIFSPFKAITRSLPWSVAVVWSQMLPWRPFWKRVAIQSGPPTAKYLIFKRVLEVVRYYLNIVYCCMY